MRSIVAPALAGLTGVAAFAPLGYGPLAIFCVAALILLWQHADNAKPSSAALAGFAFGLGHFGGGVSWVYVSMHDIGMMPAPIAALATLLFCAWLALFPAMTGYVQARLRGAIPPAVNLLLVIPAAWALGEWLRGWVWTGFPWLALGYSQTDTPLAGYAPVLGVFGVSFATVVAAALLVLMALRYRHARLVAISSIAGLAVLLACGWLLARHAWTTPAGAPVTVALAQGNVPQSMKFEEGRYAGTLETYRKLVEQSSAQLTILPETAIPRFIDAVDRDYLESLARAVQQRGGDLLLGAPMRAQSPDGRAQYTNSVVSMGASRTQTYSKVHLVPFGEFIPPGFGWVLDIMRIPLSDFTRGSTSQQPLMLGAGLRVALNICYEDAFGEEIARQLPAATLLVNVSNVAWFGDSLAPDQHLQISRMRSLETGRPMLRATNTGVTAIIDAQGRVAGRLPSFTEGLLQGSVQPHEGVTPFVRVGNALIVGLCLLILAAAFALARIRRRSP
jgi:apolipoprotein N-acyltransferase